MRRTMPSIGGITWERLQAEDSVTYPCLKEGDPGDSVVFVDRFPTATGKARFVPADIIPADERPDTDLSAGVDHRPPAGTLAHGQHDAPLRRAGLH